MKLKTCPKCGSKLGDRWASGRTLTQYCIDTEWEDCNWVGKPRTPESKRITAFRDLRISDFYGWCYITYDKFGHVACHSRSYGTEKEAQTEMEGDMTRSNATDPCRPYTGVLFFIPSTVKLKGKIFKTTKDNKIKRNK